MRVGASSHDSPRFAIKKENKKIVDNRSNLMYSNFGLTINNVIKQCCGKMSSEKSEFS